MTDSQIDGCVSDDSGSRMVLEKSHAPLHLSIDDETLTKAIAVALVERAHGAEGLQALEAKVVGRHLRTLVDERLTLAIDAAVQVQANKLIEKRMAELDATVAATVAKLTTDRVIDDFVRQHLRNVIGELVAEHRSAILERMNALIASMAGGK